MSKRTKRPSHGRRVRRSKNAATILQTRPRGASEASASETDDPYLAVIDEQWDKILMMYNLFADKRPVMLYGIQDQKIYAYPYQEFKADLNQRSQALLERQYSYAQTNNQMVLFIRDNEKRVFRSYVLDLDP